MSRQVDYVAARMALGMTRAEAEAATALARVHGGQLARQIRRGEIRTARQLRRALGAAELMVAGAARSRAAA
ncbi:MAG TPA: hypothetical protein VFI42_15995 [Thermomicrobiaceae bacterium]|nr:hypothetical protein [Thermomicrobiaceae bacterium]